MASKLVIFLEKLAFFISGLVTLPFGLLFSLLTLLGLIKDGHILLIYAIAGLEVWAKPTDKNEA